MIARGKGQGVRRSPYPLPLTPYPFSLVYCWEFAGWLRLRAGPFVNPRSEVYRDMPRLGWERPPSWEKVVSLKRSVESPGNLWLARALFDLHAIEFGDFTL